MNPWDRLRLAYRTFRSAPMLAARLEYGIDERPETLNYQDLYSTSAAVYACIKLRADTLSRPILRLYRMKDGQSKEVLDHPLRQLIDRMNPFWTRVQMWRQIETDLLWHGNAFIGLEHLAGSKAPHEMWRMRPDWMQVVPDRSHYIKGYLYNVEGIVYPWEPQEVIHFRYANPLNEYWGLSPLTAARYSAELGIDATKFNRNFFLNASVAATALISKVNLSKDQADDLTRRWEAAFVGVTKAHKTAVLSPDLSVEKLTINQRDAEWINAMKWSLADVARVLRVPEPLVGEEKAVYKNIREAETAFWHECQIPELLWMEEILNAQLVPLFDDSSLYVAFDVSMIEAIQADVAAVIEGHTKYLTQGVMTINEVRRKERLGDDVPWGNVAWLPMNLMPMGKTATDQKQAETNRLDLALKARTGEEVTLKVVPSSTVSPDPETLRSGDPVRSQSKQRQMDDEISDEIEELLANFFETEAKAIARAYSRSVRQMEYDWERWRKLERPLSRSTKRQMESAAEGAFVEVGTSAIFDLKNIRAIEWSEENAATLIRGVTEETKSNVRRIVNEGVSEGWARDKIANTIMEHPDFNKARAQMIARTETQRSFNQGNLRGYEESGVVTGKSWMTMNDDRVSPICHMNEDMGVIGLKAPFASGHDAPPVHPNCRCRLMPVVNEDAELRGERYQDVRTVSEAEEWAKQRGYSHDAGAPLTLQEHNKLNREIAKIPQPLLHQGKAKGVTLRGFKNRGITTHPDYIHLKGKMPRGWESTGQTWDDVPGGGFIAQKRVVIRANELERGHGSANLILHESAHIYDDVMYSGIGTYTDSASFKSLHAASKSKILRVASRYEADYPEEWFAEQFAIYFNNPQGAKKVLQNFPELIDIFKIMSRGEIL